MDAETRLIWRIRHRNDQKAAYELVEKHYQEIYTYAYRQTLDK